MKEILYNYDNLKEEEIDEIVIRTKGLIINSKNEITLGYSHNTYQFPGGHLEEGETLSECLIREIKEETGININVTRLKPFIKLTHLTKNYRSTGKNRCNEIYYFIIKTDETFDMNNSNLDDWEKEGNYVVKTFPLHDVERILVDSIPDNIINKVIVEEMFVVLNEFKNMCFSYDNLNYSIL